MESEWIMHNVLKALLIGWALLSGANASVAAANSSVRVERLRCEYLVNPLGVHEAEPRLSWIVESPRRGEQQTAYEILVASTPELLNQDKGDLWASGKVASQENAHIVYTGKPLTSRQGCYWKVRVYDRDGKASAWSASASWEMGLLSPDDWDAKWIQSRIVLTPARREHRGFHSGLSPKPDSDKWVAIDLGSSQQFDAVRLFPAHAPALQDPPIMFPVRFRIEVSDAADFAASKTVVDKTAEDVPSPGASVPKYTFAAVTARYVRLFVTRLGAHPGNPGNYGIGMAEMEVLAGDKNLVRNASVTALDAIENGEWSKDRLVDGVTGPEKASPAIQPAPFLRKSFNLADKPVVKARVFATAMGLYELRLNGQRVGDHVLAPEWTDYRKFARYQSYDVTKLLKRADNVLNACLAPGWFSGHVAQHFQVYGKVPSLLVQMEVTYTDGSCETVVTDGTWKTHVSPITDTSFLLGESHDARLEISDVDKPGYDDTQWQNAVQLGSDVKAGPKVVDVTAMVAAAVKDGKVSLAMHGGNLGGDPAFGVLKRSHVKYLSGGKERTRLVAEGAVLELAAPDLKILKAYYGDIPTDGEGVRLEGQVMEPVRQTGELKPRALTEPKPGCWTFDLGQNMVGVVQLKVSAPAGTKVTLRHGEMLNPDGTLYTANLRSALSIDTYICKGGGVEVWQPKFTFHGFRYVELTGLPAKPEPDAVTGVVIGSDILKTGDFSCSDQRINQLFSNIWWGQRGNYLSVPTDCPQRDERMGWMGDAQVFVKTATGNANVGAFFTKWLDDVDNEAAATGVFGDIAPNLEGFAGSPAWADAGVICPWTIYQAYGDRRLLERHLPAMIRWVEFLMANCPDRTRNCFWGDWLSIGAETSKDVVGTAFFAYSADLVSRSCRALGKTEEAAKYGKLFNEIKAAFAKRFVKPDGRIESNTQACYVLALKFNLLSEEMRPKAVQHLEEDIRAKNDHLSTGFVTTPHLLPVLTAEGRQDTAFKLMMQDSFPSWLFSVKKGATTIWERWDGWTPEKGFQDAGMNSFNHYAFGACGEWLYESLAGLALDPSGPGYRKILIHPHVGGGITSARASMLTMRGKLSVEWKREGSVFTLDCVVPVGSEATVVLPASDAKSITEGGKPLGEVKEIVLIGQSGNAVTLVVGSGKYVFRVFCGSELIVIGFTRTQADQQANAVEKADDKTLVQMAIVYQGNQISIYRNGEPYTSYEASNVDLLKTQNQAVFGLRHEGAGPTQTLRGSIEEARIYDKALTADEIKKLETNKESGIKPYAWWTFEKGMETDRMGRFSVNNLYGGAKIEGGRLVLASDGATLIAAGKAAHTVSPDGLVTPAMPENPPANWLTYHLIHPGPGNAMPGDPNCAFYWKDRYVPIEIAF
jgi:alpha-L-rhamnosidase